MRQKLTRRELQAFRKRKEVNRLVSIRDMRLKEGKTYEEIGNALRLKITRQAVYSLIKEHYPLLALVDAKAFRKHLSLKYKLSVGTKVIVRLPVEATVHKVSQNSGYTLKHGEQEWEYFGENEVYKIRD